MGLFGNNFQFEKWISYGKSLVNQKVELYQITPKKPQKKKNKSKKESKVLDVACFAVQSQNLIRIMFESPDLLA